MEARIVWQVLQCSSVNSCIQEVRLILTPTLILTEATGLRAKKKTKKPGNWKKRKEKNDVSSCSTGRSREESLESASSCPLVEAAGRKEKGSICFHLFICLKHPASRAAQPSMMCVCVRSTHGHVCQFSGEHHHLSLKALSRLTKWYASVDFANQPVAHVRSLVYVTYSTRGPQTQTRSATQSHCLS